MTREEILERFKGGFVIGDGMETIELVVNDKVKCDDVLKLWAYDASLYPLPDYSHWMKEAQDKVKAYVLKRTQGLNIEVWIDDTQIKEQVNG
ncbi:hypothetical protein ACRHK7_01195 [Weissella tructae]|uniref:hypothetical protein n=1 Tax=Weissella tructae TaxID=887702 RepID=UPI003D93D434